MLSLYQMMPEAPKPRIRYVDQVFILDKYKKILPPDLLSYLVDFNKFWFDPDQYFLGSELKKNGVRLEDGVLYDNKRTYLHNLTLIKSNSTIGYMVIGE